MKRENAEHANRILHESAEQLLTWLATVRASESSAETERCEKAVGHILGAMQEGLLERVWVEYPDLDPEHGNPR